MTKRDKAHPTDVDADDLPESLKQRVRERKSVSIEEVIPDETLADIDHAHADAADDDDPDAS